MRKSSANDRAAGVKLIILQLGNMDLTSSADGLTLKLLAAVADFE
jgi:putative DNA-invertase from lambdoid prophage Rac